MWGLLPAVFAIGLHALHVGAPATTTRGDESSERIVGNPLGVAIAVVCFRAHLARGGWRLVNPQRVMTDS